MAEPSLTQPNPSTQPPLPTPPNRGSNHPVHKTLVSVANLANLLPTGTVLAFQALSPPFSNNGTCQLSNKYLTACLIAFCTIACFLSSFTDSFTGCDGKIYYGIATFKGLYIFNNEDHCKGDEAKINKEELSKYKISFIDFVHASLSLFVFVIFTLSSSDVQSCFFPKAGANEMALMMNMPLGAGVLSSLLFTIFPSTRRGIGYSDMAPQA